MQLHTHVLLSIEDDILLRLHDLLNCAAAAIDLEIGLELVNTLYFSPLASPPSLAAPYPCLAPALTFSFAPLYTFDLRKTKNQ